MIDERLHIEELLRRFMEGETTLDEERLLGDWLRTHEVNDSLKPYQRMFAAFDEGLPLPADGAEQPTSTLTSQKSGGDELKRQHLAWWHWAAAAVIAGLMATGGIWLAKQPAATPEQTPITAKGTPTPPAARTPENVDIKPTVAENRQEVDKPAAPVVSANKTEVKTKPQAMESAKQDSIEVARTAGDLELAESEFQAERQELERQLQELRQQRLARQSGWHYTSLPCE